MEPVYVEGQVQVLGAEHVPPFKQAEEHTATIEHRNKKLPIENYIQGWNVKDCTRKTFHF